MRITRIETDVSPENMVVVVRVGTDTGLEGIGQTAPRRADITAAVLHALVAPSFLGQNPWDHQQLVDRCLRTHYKFTDSFLYRALCGVETALWDLLEQATGQPELQQVQPLTIRSYVSAGRTPTSVRTRRLNKEGDNDPLSWLPRSSVYENWHSHVKSARDQLRMGLVARTTGADHRRHHPGGAAGQRHNHYRIIPSPHARHPHPQ